MQTKNETVFIRVFKNSVIDLKQQILQKMDLFLFLFVNEREKQVSVIWHGHICPYRDKNAQERMFSKLKV